MLCYYSIIDFPFHLWHVWDFQTHHWDIIRLRRQETNDLKKNLLSFTVYNIRKDAAYLLHED